MKPVKENYFPLIFIGLLVSLMFGQIVSIQAQVLSKTSKILNGFRADIETWPWMVGLVRSGSDVFSGQFCGGALISDRWVLTAAHCVAGQTTSTVKILAGHTRLSDAAESDLLSVSQIVIHPAFNQFTLDSDLALLELNEATTISPIQTLGHYSSDDRPGVTATVLGWGNTASFIKRFPDELHEVDLPLISNDLCATNINGVTENILCAGFAFGGKDTCVGDSGGPLVVFDAASRAWHQAGITSFGVGCGVDGFFGGYTRVKNFSDFISSIICSDSELPAAPKMDLQVSGGNVTVSWTRTTNLGGYRLNYAPFPDAFPINSIDMQEQDNYSITLSSGDAFFVAINAYEGNCRSGLSNIIHFNIN